MNIKLIKEKKNMYYAELVWVKHVYAQWETAEKAVENLGYVYEMIQEYVADKQQKKIESFFSAKSYRSLLDKVNFTSMTLVI